MSEFGGKSTHGHDGVVDLDGTVTVRRGYRARRRRRRWQKLGVFGALLVVYACVFAVVAVLCR